MVNAYSPDQAKAFCTNWLPAWTGNQPELLASFYSEDCLYLDAAVPDGVKGRDNLTAYFRRLLARYPDWVWTNEEAVPMENGFVNLWKAVIPQGDKTLTLFGVCLVWLKDGEIYRNQVYFDRSELLPKAPKP